MSVSIAYAASVMGDLADETLALVRRREHWLSQDSRRLAAMRLSVASRVLGEAAAILTNGITDGAGGAAGEEVVP